MSLVIVSSVIMTEGTYFIHIGSEGNKMSFLGANSHHGNDLRNGKYIQRQTKQKSVYVAIKVTGR